MKQYLYLIILLSFMTLNSCTSKNEDKVVPHKLQSFEKKYHFQENGCDTGNHEFTSENQEKTLRQYCEALRNEDLNHSCARSLRFEIFKTECKTYNWDSKNEEDPNNTNTPIPTSVPIINNPQPPILPPNIILEDLPIYQPIDFKFVFDLKDDEKIRQYLRKMTSPTRDFQNDLVELVDFYKNRGNTISSNLGQILITASFYSAQQINELKIELATLEKQNQSVYINNPRYHEIKRAIYNSQIIAPFVNALIYTIIENSENISFDVFYEYLKLIYPDINVEITYKLDFSDENKFYHLFSYHIYTDSNFQQVYYLLNSLSKMQVQQLKELAVAKEAFSFIGELEAQDFNDKNESTFDKLKEKLVTLNTKSIDSFLIGTVPNLTDLNDIKKVVNITEFSVIKKGKITGLAYKKVKQYSNENILFLLNNLNKEQYADFIDIAIDCFVTITSDKLIEILSITKQEQIVLSVLNKISDLTLLNTLKIANFLTESYPYNKSQFIKKYINKSSDKLTTNELISLLKIMQTEDNKFEVLNLALSKLTDFTEANLLLIANCLIDNYPYYRSQFVSYSIENQQGKLSTEGLISLLKVMQSEEYKFKVASLALNKLTDFTEANLLLIANCLSDKYTYYRSQFVSYSIENQQGKLSTEGLISLLKIMQSEEYKFTVASLALNKLIDFTEANLLLIANCLSDKYTSYRSQFVKLAHKK